MTPDKLTPAPSKGAPSSAPASKAPPPTPANSSVHPAPKNLGAGHSASALIAAAGLPADKLSAAIVSFARFFSLPLKPELMAAIRRQALSPPVASAADPVPKLVEGAEAPKPPHAPDSGITAKIREALSLAAAAAESKGVELHPQGLERFAEAINPDQKRHDSGEHERRREKDQKDQENSPKTSPITAAGLKEIALESAGKDPLLTILNRLPGKNGRRWVVLPFSFCEEGRKFNVALRILLEHDEQALNRAVCMVMDIGEGERSWLFVLTSASQAARLAVYLEPELPPAACAQLAGELSRLMEIPLGHISIRNRTELFPGESGYGGDSLHSVNEAI